MFEAETENLQRSYKIFIFNARVHFAEIKVLKDNQLWIIAKKQDI